MKTRIQIEVSGPQDPEKVVALSQLKECLETLGWTVINATAYEGAPLNPDVLIATKDYEKI